MWSVETKDLVTDVCGGLRASRLFSMRDLQSPLFIGVKRIPKSEQVVKERCALWRRNIVRTMYSYKTTMSVSGCAVRKLSSCQEICGTLGLTPSRKRYRRLKPAGWLCWDADPGLTPWAKPYVALTGWVATRTQQDGHRMVRSRQRIRHRPASFPEYPIAFRWRVGAGDHPTGMIEISCDPIQDCSP